MISAVSNARPKVANYHFTTLNPVLGVVDFGGGEGFVMADIPGLIEGASEGVGLGHEFLRHIDRCKLLLHVVDAAGTEGRDPVEDIRAINQELEKYDAGLLQKPQIIVCNKCDAIYTEEGQEDPILRIRREFETENTPVFAISAVTGEGTKELLKCIQEKLAALPREVKIYEPEFEYEVDSTANLPYTVEVNEENEFVVEGPRIEKMLGYTNLDSEKGYVYFTQFMKRSAINDDLLAAGIADGGSVRMRLEARSSGIAVFEKI